jgi:hypothetical protein
VPQTWSINGRTKSKNKLPSHQFAYACLILELQDELVATFTNP